jgi:hypothetical protein
MSVTTIVCDLTGAARDASALFAGLGPVDLFKTR